MKLLRFILLFGGAALVLWGVVDYFGTETDSYQAVSKMILGFVAVLASFLARRMR